MRKIIFDIETQNTFQQVGSDNPADLDISLICLHDSKDDKYYTFMHNELDGLWPFLEEADVVIGFNSDHFDLPVLNKYYKGDLLKKVTSLDILKEVKNSLGKRIKLDTIAEATLGVNKSGDGLDAIKWWNSGEIEKIKKYCLDDVRITKEVYEYALKNGKLKYKDKITHEIKEFKLDTSGWEKFEEKEEEAATQGFLF